jgi:ankyrin repeat protein
MPMVKRKKTLLFQAIAENNTHRIAEILNSGVSANVTNSIGITPLMAAAGINNEDIINLLINHGADIDAVDVIGRSAFRYALKNKSKKALLSLIDAQCDALE